MTGTVPEAPKDKVSTPVEAEEEEEEEEDSPNEAPAPVAPPPVPAERKRSNPNCCGKFMNLVANDALYGSFVGPHPVNFLFLFSACKGCCSQNCVRPFCVASIATKVMYLGMLGAVTLLASFFIIPWKKTLISHSSTSIAAFYPCQGKVMRNQELNGGCEYYAGYYMVYRCFFAFGTIMLTNSLIMINVKSSDKNYQRAKIHRGFWFYKYLYLSGLLLLYFLFLDGNSDKEGIFEYICSIIGHMVNILFTVIEFAFILDIVGLWVRENQTSGSSWADFIYWLITGVIVILDLVVLGYIITEFLWEQKFPNDKVINCVTGEKHQLDFIHLILIGLSVGVMVFLVMVMSAKKHYAERFPHVGWLQVAVIGLFNFLYLWSALYSSPRVSSRPHCKYAQEVLLDIQDGSKGIYFRPPGLFHGVLAVLTLLYFAFVHGPKSDTAPFSVAYYSYISDRARIPVFPNKEDSPEEFLDAVKEFNVWDDEKDAVACSWSLFYVMMMMTGFSLMMSMTNFFDPWGGDRYNSSTISLGCKLGSSILATFLYITLLVTPNTKIDPQSEVIKNRRSRYYKDGAVQDVEKEGGEEKVSEAIEKTDSQAHDAEKTDKVDVAAKTETKVEPAEKTETKVEPVEKADTKVEPVEKTDITVDATDKTDTTVDAAAKTASKVKAARKTADQGKAKAGRQTDNSKVTAAQKTDPGKVDAAPKTDQDKAEAAPKKSKADAAPKKSKVGAAKKTGPGKADAPQKTDSQTDNTPKKPRTYEFLLD